MSVLIKGMEKTEHCGYCRFRYDGICHALQRTQYSMNECPLVVIDDAGLNDTISRQAAIDAVNSHFGFNIEEEYGSAVQEVINGLPSAQPERKKGKWILKRNIYGVAYCSECDYELHTDNTNYCPNCGARMDGEENG